MWMRPSSLPFQCFSLHTVVPFLPLQFHGLVIFIPYCWKWRCFKFLDFFGWDDRAENGAWKRLFEKFRGSFNWKGTWKKIWNYSLKNLAVNVTFKCQISVKKFKNLSDTQFWLLFIHFPFKTRHRSKYSIFRFPIKLTFKIRQSFFIPAKEDILSEGKCESNPSKNVSCLH